MILLCEKVNQQGGVDLAVIITAIISVVTLFINILFYIIIAPRLNYKYQIREKLLN